MRQEHVRRVLQYFTVLAVTANAADQSAAGDRGAARARYTGPWSWSSSGSAAYARSGCGRRSGRGTGRGRWCSSTGRDAEPPQICGRERRSTRWWPPCRSRAQTAFFSFDLGLESFLEGHARTFAWLGGCRAVRLRQSALGGGQPRAGPGHLESAVPAPARPLRLSRHRLHPATPREKGSVEGSVRYLKTGFWPARRVSFVARSRCAVRRLARPDLQPSPARHRPLPGR